MQLTFNMGKVLTSLKLQKLKIQTGVITEDTVQCLLLQVNNNTLTFQ